MGTRCCAECGASVENLQGLICWTCRKKLEADVDRVPCGVCGAKIAAGHAVRHAKTHLPPTPGKKKRAPPVDFHIRDQQLRKKFLAIHEALGHKTTNKAEYEKTIAEIIEMQFNDLKLEK